MTHEDETTGRLARMDPKQLWKPCLLYTGLLGALTVGTVYLATRSGLLILGLAAAGLLTAVLNGGTPGRTSLGGAERADEGGLEVEPAGLLPHTESGIPLRLTLLFYGLGVFLWSVVVMFGLTESLA